jgi:hypothetical protein
VVRPDLPKVLWGKCKIPASLLSPRFAGVKNAPALADEREEKEAKIRRWRQAADECRAMAADTKDPQGLQSLLDLARAYDEAADQVQESLNRA